MKKLIVGSVVLLIIWLGYSYYIKSVEASIGVEKHPIAKVYLNTGDYFEMQLYPEEAPNTVNNFIYLAQKGFYTGTKVNRMIPGVLVQAGDPIGNGKGFPGYFIESECRYNGVRNGLKHEKGVVSMARSAAFNTEGSQFFIMLEDNHYLDGKYSAFGKITQGLEAVEALSTQWIGDENEVTESVWIDKIEVECYGVTYVEPEVLSVREVLAQYD